MRWSASEAASNTSALPLSMLKDGDRAIMVEVRGGHGMQRRLAEMGLMPGMEIEVSSDTGSPGPLIVRVMESRIAIGRGMAPRIMVQPL